MAKNPKQEFNEEDFIRIRATVWMGVVKAIIALGMAVVFVWLGLETLSQDGPPTRLMLLLVDKVGVAEIILISVVVVQLMFSLRGPENLIEVASLVGIILERANRVLPPKTLALSFSYLAHVKTQTTKVVVWLLLCTFACMGLQVAFDSDALRYCAITCLVLASLLLVKYYVASYRIRNGVFGTNRGEAKAFIEFLAANADDVDFTDDNGKLRRALKSESLFDDLRKAEVGGEVGA